MTRAIRGEGAGMTEGHPRRGWCPHASQVVLFTGATLCKFFEPIAVDLSKLPHPPPPSSPTATAAVAAATDGAGGATGATGAGSDFGYSFSVALAATELTKMVVLLLLLGGTGKARRLFSRTRLAWLLPRRRLFSRAPSSGEDGEQQLADKERAPSPDGAPGSGAATTAGGVRTTWMYAVAALLLAVVNQLMFVGVAKLGPLLYQIVFQATSTIATGACSELVLGKPLSRLQWAALFMLCLGFCLTLPGFDPWDVFAILRNKQQDGSGSATAGLACAGLGGMMFSFQNVLFEAAASRDEKQSVLVQSLLFAALGLAANLTLFAAMAEPGDYAGAFVGFELWPTWCAVLGIVFADLSMAVLVKQLGSNTYSFSRAVATCGVGVWEFLVLGTSISLQFVAGSALVTAAAFAYKQGGH